MVTKYQARMARHGDELHYTGREQCSRTVGPRGGTSERIVRVRVNGNLQTWQRDSLRFRLPVKHGLRAFGAVLDTNAQDFHLASECPLNQLALPTPFPVSNAHAEQRAA